MIKAVRIKNFRSCIDVAIKGTGSLVALVGRNGVGKSNILRAIQWASKAASTSSRVDLVDSRFRPRLTKVGLDISLKSDDYRYEISSYYANRINDKHGQDNPIAFRERLLQKVSGRWRRLVERDNDQVKYQLGSRLRAIRVDRLAASMPAIASVLPDHGLTVSHIRPLLSFLRTIRYYPLDEPNDLDATPFIDEPPLISESSYRDWLTQYRTSGDPGASVAMRLLHSALEEKHLLEELNQLVGRNGLTLLEDISVTSYKQGMQFKELENLAKTYYSLIFRPIDSSGYGLQAFDYVELSHGTRRILRIVTSLLIDRSSVMLLEHPEDGIHRGLLRKLIGLLKSYCDPSQLFITSHSAVVFDELQPDEIRWVTIKEGQTQVRGLTRKEKEVAKEFVGGDSPLAMSDLLDSMVED